MKVNERIAELRKRMKKNGIDIYYVPNEDDHLSEEYTADYFKCKSYLSGFSGDYGCTIVTDKEAGLWTDGRYFTQAEDELKGTCVKLFRLRQAGVPSPIEYLLANTPNNGTLGFDGHVVSTAVASMLKNALQQKKAKTVTSLDLAGEVWGQDRPAMPKDSIYVLPKKYTGESASQRISKVREKMKAAHADVLVLTQLEDPCWLFNIRGNDIACTPIAYAFALVTDKKAFYYIDKSKVSGIIAKELKADGITLRPYESLGSDLAKLKNKTVWADLNTLNASLSAEIDKSNQIYNHASPVGMFRAVKNNKEIANTKNAHIKDGVAMVKFLYWIKNHVGRIEMSEISAADKLYALRAEQKDYIEPSFPTIAGYKGNAAMMHYSASDKSNAKINAEGFLLVDSGGTYYDGTTDITRTIALGKISDEDKMYFTKVLKGHLDLMMAKFLEGTTGCNLDILARGPMWNIDIDYQCGTGHGVGHVLSVHEGPQGIRWGVPPMSRPNPPLVPGMIVTDEPGVYLPHKLGIRTENELLVVKGKKNFYGQFLQFDVLTFVPIDLDAVDSRYLNKDEIDYLNAYHAEVYKKISPFLNAKEKAWLKKATRKIA